jgi:hypothetical protein
MNLVEVIKNQLSNGTISRLSALIGAGEDATRFAAGAAVPAVLSALSTVASSKDGVQRLVSALGEFDRGPMSDVHSMLSKEPGAVLEEGNNLLTTLFGGGTVSGIANALAGFAGLGSGAVQRLLGYLVPLVLGGIAGRFAAPLNAQGLTSMLADQKSNIANALPPGLSLGNVAGLQSRKAETRQASDAVRQTGLSSWRWLVPVLGIGIVVVLLWWFLRPGAGILRPASNASVPNVTQLTIDLSRTFRSLTETLTGIKDAASAQAALSTLKELNGELESARSVAGRLPEAGKATITAMAQSALDRLRVLVDKVLAMAGVGDQIKPVVDGILDNLKALAG